MADKTVDLLNLMRGPRDTAPGLHIIIVNTTDPAPITFLFEGTPLPLDLDLFEVPVSCYPLRKGDRLLAFPLIGKGASQRWGVIQKINGGAVMATMTGATSCQVTGIGRAYTAQDLIIPEFFAVKAAYNDTTDWQIGVSSKAPATPKQVVYADYTEQAKNWVTRPLKAGDLVTIAPTLEGVKIKYVIIELVKGA